MRIRWLPLTLGGSRFTVHSFLTLISIIIIVSKARERAIAGFSRVPPPAPKRTSGLPFREPAGNVAGGVGDDDVGAGSAKPQHGLKGETAFINPAAFGGSLD